MNKILIIEDDKDIRNTLKEILTERDFLVEALEDGTKTLEIFKKSPPDLLLLDLSLPKINGESICAEIHKLYPSLPIIILTAKSSPEDVVNGLSIGAADYIRKPFDIEELVARIKVRLKKTDSEVLEADDLSMNTKNMEVTRAGKRIDLTPHEFKLLKYLLMNKGHVLTREMILSRVWQYNYDVGSRVVDVYIGYLRKKIDKDFQSPLINGLRGFGYSIKSN